LFQDNCYFTSPYEFYFCCHKKIIENIKTISVWEIITDQPGRQIIRNEVVLSENDFRLTTSLQNNYSCVVLLVASASTQRSFESLLILIGLFIYAPMQKDMHMYHGLKV
jgi:hypothetical protein